MKAKESKEPTIELYNPDIEQEIPLTLHKNGHDYEVSHTLSPLTDERFFQREREFQATLKRLEKTPDANPLASDNLLPVTTLWNDLATGRKGYKERADWREKTHPFDKRTAIAALLHAQPVEAADSVESDVFDEDTLTIIGLNVMQSGMLIGTAHSFREETKAEMDEFTAMLTGAAAGGLASRARITDAERLSALYDEMCLEQTGYVGRVPAWHKAAAVRTYFERRVEMLGKSITA